MFDFPNEFVEQLQGYWKDSARIQMGPITELPELDESSMTDNNSRGGGGGGYNKPARGGGGDRNGGRSSMSQLAPLPLMSILRLFLSLHRCLLQL